MTPRLERRFEGNHEKPVSKADMLVEIRTQHLQNTGYKRHRLSQLARLQL
jgi:hypothetical protein